MDEYFKNLEKENLRRRKELNNENHEEPQASENPKSQEIVILDEIFEQPKQPQPLTSVKQLFKIPNKSDDKEYKKAKARFYKQKSRESLSEEAKDAVRAADRLRKSASKTPVQIIVENLSSQNSSISSTPKRRRLNSATIIDSNNGLSSILKKRNNSQISLSQDDIILDDVVFQSAPKRQRQSSQITLSNSQASYDNYDFPSQSFVNPSPSQFYQFQQSLNIDDGSQLFQSKLIKSINDIKSLFEIYLNLEENGLEAFESILSEFEESKFQEADIEEKQIMLETKKCDICLNIKNLIQNLIEIANIETIKNVIFEKIAENEASMIALFIFDGIENVEDFEQIQIASLISTIQLYIRKAKFISKIAYDETAKIRESLMKFLNKSITGIAGTDDHENRKILGFSFHTVNRTEHATIGFSIKELFPQIFNNFMSMNSAKTDYIFLHPGKNCDKKIDQNVSDSRNSTSQTSTVSNSQTSTTASNINSLNSAQNSAQNSIQNSKNSSQNSIQNSQNSAQNPSQNSSQNSAQNPSQNSYNSQEDILEVEILQSEGFKNRFQAKTYINESRGFLCTSECPSVPANFGKKLIPFLQNLAYSNSSNIFYVLEDFKIQCLQQISLHAPCFQGLRTIKRKYNELIRHVKIMASVNQIFHKCNFKILENFVNNQKLPTEIAEELHTKFLPKVSDLTEPMATAKYGILMEKFFKDDQDIAASFCQICHQIFRASSLMQMKYEIVEELCVQAIPGNLKENYRKESKILISVCVECRNNIKKKTLPPMAITNEMDVTPLKGVLSNLTKLEWTLLKPIRISKTIINIYPNKNYEMIEAINSVENGKPITVTQIPSAATIQIYIHGKIDNLKPVSRPKLFEAYKILKEINPFYKNIEYNPNFKFTNTCVKFDKKISNPDYSILIDESGNDRNLADFDFYGIDQDLNPLQQGTVLNRFLKRKPLQLFINSTHTNHEVQCFPNCFPDGKFGRHVSTRTIPISDIKWIKNRVNHISRQYNDPELLMFLKSFKDTKALFGAVGITFREIKDVLNVTDLIKTFQQERYSVVMDSALTTKFRSLRGSIDYFNTVEKELQCVVDTIGPAAFYITANPSPDDWENLRKTYLTIYSNISEIDYNCDKMIAKDPVIFSTYFRNRLHNLLRNVILNKDGPFGELIHHFFRIDYQESNLTHCHMIFWSKNEVTLEKLGEDKCIELIDKCVTCRIPDPISESSAYNYVIKNQKHSSKCSKSCMIKTFDGENFECRYGFPKRSREYTKLNLKKGKLFEDKSMGWRQYELKRKLNEDLIGDYNLVLLLLWKGNINVQVLISGNNSKLIQYLTKSMPAKSLSQCEQINNRITKSLSMTNVAKIGAQFLQNKPLGSVEIVEHLLGMPLCSSSFNVVFINTNPPEKRRKMLATKIEPENLTPENVYQTTILDNYLPGRDVYLQKFGYYNIAAYFKIVRRDEVDLNSKMKETENREVDENVEDTDDENFIDETDYSNLCNPQPSDSSQFSQLSDVPSQTSISATSTTPSYIPSKEDILTQQKYGGNAFLKAGYSIFDEKSPTFCHPKIKAGTIFSSGCEKIFFLKRSKPKIPRFYLGYFDEDNFDKVNDYFRRLCIKFIPFDKEEHSVVTY